MNNHNLLYFLRKTCIVLLLSFCSCNDDNTINSFSNERSFRMGFTPFPYDITAEAQQQSYTYAKTHGDIVLAHFDHGVPWNEALNNLPFPEEIQNAINGTIAIKTNLNKIVLTATAININRNGLANYWNNNGAHQTLPSPWDSYSFDNNNVITAYLNYCRRIINRINPDYFAYSIEVNAEFLENTAQFNAYLIFAETVYTTLKNEYPSLPVFLTFQDQSFNKTKEELHSITRLLLEYSDMVAVSSYPFWQYQFPNQDANPDLFSDDWLRDIRALAPNKPFAISETGYIAEDLVMNDFGVHVSGNPLWQSNYLEKLFRESHELNAEFVLWFIYRDYDLLYNNTTNPPPVFKIWRDNGLLDGSGNRRISHDTWDLWKSYTLN